ncbi:hypothetical protein, partial [Desulfotomaculum copahuensis]|uniref:hypothetical protein n=1 Tax=Desulfotomaculum copahuensis TaxID=1838280 RepID=UPI003CFEC064
MFAKRRRDDFDVVRAPEHSGGKRLRRWLMTLILLLAGLTALGWAGARQLGVVPPAGVLAGIIRDQLSGKGPPQMFSGGGAAGFTGDGMPGAGPAGTGNNMAALAAGGGSSAGGKGAVPGG